jgi:Matrixin
LTESTRDAAQPFTPDAETRFVIRRRLALLVVASLGVALIQVAPVATERTDAAAPTTAFSVVGPIRLLDTRAGGAPAPAGGSTIVIPARSFAGVPADAIAASITIVATQSSGPGFVTVWGDGERPTTSVLNLDGAGQTRANFAIAPIGADGNVRIFTQVSTHLVVDLTGAFRPASAATSGRLVPLGPERLVDTRLTAEPLAPNELRTVDAAEVGVPASAQAVVVSFTAIGPPGWFAAWPAGTPWPGTSVVNTEAAGTPSTASAIVPLTNGQFDITSLRGGEVILDVSGYFTGSDAMSSTEGLFVPVPPTRVVDTRGPTGTRSPIGPAITLTTSAFPFSAATAGSVSINITTIVPETDGYLTAYPAGFAQPNAAVSNARGREILAAGAITPSSAAGINVFTQARTHLAVDTTGYFVTAPRALPSPTTPTTPVYSASYLFSVTATDGSPIRWNPCQPVLVNVNFTNAQPHARGSFADAIEQARISTGLNLVVNETTTTVPTNGTLSVRWGSAADVPQLTGSVLALGGFSYSSRRIVRGSVIVRSDLAFTSSRNGENTLTGTLAHELAHALGLAHVNDASQLMYPFANGLDRYQAGDRTGLGQLGAGAGCLLINRSSTERGDQPIGTVVVIDEMDPLDPVS